MADLLTACTIGDVKSAHATMAKRFPDVITVSIHHAHRLGGHQQLTALGTNGWPRHPTRTINAVFGSASTGTWHALTE